MFDSLKEKLGSFREDVEETAEEKAEAAEEAAEPDAESPADQPATATADAATDAGGDTEADVDADTGSTTATTTAAEPGAETDSDSGTGTGTESGDDRAPLTNPAETDSSAEKGAGKSGAGFGSKVKSFATGKFVIEEEDIEEPLWELEMALLESDVEMSVTDEIVEGLKRELVGETRGMTTTLETTVQKALREAILSVISVGQFDFDERVAAADKPMVVVFTGVNGVGKTTTIAKMARYLEDRGYSTVLANGDTYRAGANEQLQEHAEALGKKCIAHEKGGDPAAVVYDAVEYAEANDVDVVLGDTAGRLHTNEGLMDQLAKIDRVVGPDMTLFVDEAVAGQDAVQRAKKFNEAAEIDGTVLTKADADSQGGAAISIAHVTGKPILFLGTGQGYEDLERFDPEDLVDRLLEA